MEGGSVKPCRACQIVKELTDFPPEPRNRDGRSGRCRKCQKLLPSQLPTPENKKRRKEYLEKYNKENEGELKRKSREKYLKNREKMIQASSARAKSKRAEIRLWAAGYREKNRESLRSYFRAYVAKRKVEDEDFLAVVVARRPFSNALEAIKNNRPGSGVVTTFGYNLSELKAAIESRFQQGMSWENHGEWHVDHKIPVLHFILKGETRPQVIHALCNLQPLWAEDNIKKGNRHPLEQENEIHLIH